LRTLQHLGVVDGEAEGLAVGQHEAEGTLVGHGEGVEGKGGRRAARPRWRELQ